MHAAEFDVARNGLSVARHGVGSHLFKEHVQNTVRSIAIGVRMSMSFHHGSAQMVLIKVNFASFNATTANSVPTD